jgi:prepilin-type N-terminal cleavage/methylation domain-containing protein
MIHSRRGFTLIELVVVVLLVCALTVTLSLAGPQAHRVDGLTASMGNLAAITQAAHMYQADHMGLAPLRGALYQNGQLSAWDSWSVGGKNCNVYWATSFGGGIFDESAYSRTLNPYIVGNVIPVPPGYVNTGSGSTWTFFHGTPTAADRATFQNPRFRSPGDRATRQRNWPSPTPTISGYNDVGTSYMLNMVWWSAPGLPSGFTARFNEGGARISLAMAGGNPNYVWMSDQIGDVVPAFVQATGEFGGLNRSVSAFADGRVQYLELVLGATSGPGYTLIP